MDFSGIWLQAKAALGQVADWFWWEMTTRPILALIMAGVIGIIWLFLKPKFK